MCVRLAHSIEDAMRAQVVFWLTDRDADGAAEGEDAPSIVSTVCPTAGPVPKQLPSLVHDDKGNTLYEEPSIAWMHVRIAQVTEHRIQQHRCHCLQ